MRSGIGNMESTARVSSGSTSSAMLWCAGADSRARPRSATSKSPTSARPASVSRGVLPERSNNVSPRVASSVWDRLTNRRLDPAERSRRGRKAGRVGDRDENTHLVKRQQVDHPSPPEMDSSTILPIAMIGASADIPPQCNNSKGPRMTVHVPEPKTIEAPSLAQIFTEARTHNEFLNKPVSEDLLRRAVEIAKMGPTSANQSPLRILFLRSRCRRRAAASRCSSGNLDKTMSAPVVAITAYDERFYEHLPFRFPHADAKTWFAGDPVSGHPQRFPERHFAGRLYHHRAARPGGRDRPMTGFDNAKVDAESFPEGHVKSNVLIDIGYGDPEELFPRSPRFPSSKSRRSFECFVGASLRKFDDKVLVLYYSSFGHIETMAYAGAEGARVAAPLSKSARAGERSRRNRQGPRFQARSIRSNRQGEELRTTTQSLSARRPVSAACPRRWTASGSRPADCGWQGRSSERWAAHSPRARPSTAATRRTCSRSSPN